MMSTDYLFEGTYCLRRESGATPAQQQLIANRFQAFLADAAHILRGGYDGASYPAPRALTEPELKQMQVLIASGLFINAVKDIRNITGCGLKGAKDVADRIRADMGIVP